MQPARARIGVSSCLLGNAVRYDGADKYCRHIVETLSEAFILVAFCPEVAIGLGVPRPPIQLVSVNGEVRARGVANPQQDVTHDLQGYAQAISPELENLSGYVFKSRSPSCGIADVPLYQADGSSAAEHVDGLFAGAIGKMLPALPLTNEEALLDEQRRKDFISQVLRYHKARQA